MKIICYGVIKMEEKIIENWAQKNQVEVKIVHDYLSADNADLAQGFDGVSSEGNLPVGASVYEKFRQYGIKQLSVRQVGVDNQDLAAAKKNGIKITNVAAYSPRAIAELGVTDAMYLLRKIGIYQDRMAHGDFTYDKSTISTEIFNCTVGIIGAGHIGGASAHLYSALGAKVLAYDPVYDASLEPYLTYTNFDTILAESDIISLHTPLLASTENMIDKTAFDKMKKKPILINVARGGLVDTQALIAALKNGQVSAAALDTLADETDFYDKKNMLNSLPEDYKELKAMPQVLITPHIAFFTKLAVKNSIEIALNDAKTIISGGEVKSVVNL
ncbi:D-lactate dehydrogenase [Lactobacillus kullabergensis]|uniref:D-lactate dehydrogenase n=1 Tax=Lactobacillus kullabergensis TaxID=1218493 RepID=A0A0F4LL36_9LACO|nr:D-2-hydroxyacid dehydrogenase [Lactobacillus kullabergensis]KJY59023.1 D-lactate dehydrogenase [Lactobacillus kullabergensis]